MTIQPDGQIVAVGYNEVALNHGNSRYEFALVRYNGTPTLSSPTQVAMKAPRVVPKGSKATIRGTVSSSDAACTTSQRVFLKMGKKILGPVMTSGSGAYVFATKITRKTPVQVTYPETNPCDASTSFKRVIKVS